MQQTLLNKYLKNYVFLLIAIGYCFSSCHTTKYLGPEERLLRKNLIKFKADEKLKDSGNLAYDLESKIKQKPNGNWLGIIAEERLYRSKREWLQKKGSPPSIFDEDKAKESAEFLEDYLYDRGYFDVKVDYEVKSKILNPRKLIVTYIPDLKKRYTVDTFVYNMVDTTDLMVHRILKDLQNTTLLKQGKPVDDLLWEQEKTRITQVMKEAGYTDFHRNYISQLKGDSTGNIVKLFMEVSPPFDSSQHQIFTIGEISVFDDFNLNLPRNYKHDTLINGIRFFSETGTLTTNPKTILENIYLKSGEIFQFSLKDKTTNNLRDLGVYRFVNVRVFTDPFDKTTKNFRIELTPNKTMSIGYDFELNTSINNTRSLSLFGTAASVSFQKRNLNRKAQTLSFNIEGGVQVDPGGLGKNDRLLVNSLDLRSQGNYFFPKFLDYLGFWKSLNKIKIGKNKLLLNDSFYEDIRAKAKTRISASYNWQKQINFFEITSINAAYGFDFQRSPNKRYIVNQIGVDYLFPDTIPDVNQFIRRSFGNQLFTGFLLRDFSLIHKSKPTRRNGIYEWRANFELSGMEILGVNWIYNAFSENNTVFRFNNNDIDFSKFTKLDLDGRFRRQLTPKQSFALRLNTSLALSLDSLNVPFVRQNYVGGPNSIRAWSIRELGPGSFIDSETEEPPFFQTGDFKLEFNAEYRFSLIGYLEGALFLDGGNVWTLKEDPERPGAKLSKSFLKEIAIGTGFGIRFNYSLFLIRLDIGIKLRNNGPDENNRYWEFNELSGYNLGDWFRKVNYNLAIDYPF